MSSRKPFMIVTMPRSGSYYLVSKLDSAQDIVCHGEVFKPERIDAKRDVLETLGIDPKDTGRRKGAAIALLRQLHGVTPDAIFGFKAFPSHITRYPRLKTEVLKGEDWRKVILMRNPIASYASLLRAQDTGVWVLTTSYKDKVRDDTLRKPVTFAPESLEKHLEVQRWMESLCAPGSAEVAGPAISIDYDRLDDPAEMGRLLEFLGSSARPEQLHSINERQYRGAIEDAFNNPGELRAWLRDRSLEHLLDPPQ